MTIYEEMKSKAEECRQKAKDAKCVFLKKFFLNAAEGYEKKAIKLTVEEAAIRG